MKYSTHLYEPLYKNLIKVNKKITDKFRKKKCKIYQVPKHLQW